MSFAVAQNRTVAASQDRDQFERLLKETYRQMYALAYRLSGNAADAEDLLQDAYIRAFRFFHQYDPSLPFSKWLVKIVCNANVDRIRKNGKLRTTSLDQGNSDDSSTWDIPDLSAMPDRRMIEESLSDPVQRGLAQVNPEFRTAMVLADIEGLEYEEIAQVMKTSIGTVRSRIHRGRKQLREFLIDKCPSVFSRMVDEL